MKFTKCFVLQNLCFMSSKNLPNNNAKLVLLTYDFCLGEALREKGLIPLRVKGTHGDKQHLSSVALYVPSFISFSSLSSIQQICTIYSDIIPAAIDYKYVLSIY